MSDHTARLSANNRWADSTMRFWQAADVQPVSATSHAMNPAGVTRDAPWQPRANPRAGIEELAWFEDHQAELVKFAGHWIAIVGQEVVAIGDNFDQTYNEASRLNHSDMLILPVPNEPGSDYYLIA